MYVDNKKLSKELGKWAKIVREDIKAERKRTPMTDYLGECVFLICNNMGFMPQFINYTYKDEMIGDAIENCIKYSKNYDGDKYNNAFGYISKIAYQAFVRRINISNKRYRDHLNYIRSNVNAEEFTDAINADNPNDIKGYTTHMDYLASVIDDMNIELPPEKPRKKKEVILTALEECMTKDY